MNNLCDIPKELLWDFLNFSDESAFLVVKVKPNSNIDGLSIDSNGELILNVRAQAKENEANIKVCEMIAKIFGITKSQIKIQSGHKSKIKRLILINVRN